MVMVDARTVKGAVRTDVPGGWRPGGCTIGTTQALLVVTARQLLRTLRAIVADRAYRGLKRLAARKGPGLDIKAPPPARPASSRVGCWSTSSTHLPDARAGCPAVTRAARRASARGSRSPRLATSPGARPS